MIAVARTTFARTGQLVWDAAREVRDLAAVAVAELALAMQEEILGSLPSTSREKFLKHLALVADACRDAAERSPKRSK